MDSQHSYSQGRQKKKSTVKKQIGARFASKPVCLYLASLYEVHVSIITNYNHYNTKQIETSENLVQQKLKVYC